jgi:hypothetical protein
MIRRLESRIFTQRTIQKELNVGLPPRCVRLTHQAVPLGQKKWYRAATVWSSAAGIHFLVTGASCVALDSESEAKKATSHHEEGGRQLTSVVEGSANTREEVNDFEFDCAPT